MPVIGFIRDGSAASNARGLAGFHKGLSETGYVEGQNVTVEPDPLRCLVRSKGR
jgi:hypothetical protein